MKAVRTRTMAVQGADWCRRSQLEVLVSGGSPWAVANHGQWLTLAIMVLEDPLPGQCESFKDTHPDPDSSIVSKRVKEKTKNIIKKKKHKQL